MRGPTIQPVSRDERLRLARRGAAHLYARGANQVWLFGSLARGRRQDQRSDIDLAVAGLPPDLYYRMISELYQLLGVTVDLVELDKVSPVLRAEVERSGVVLAHED